VSFQVKTQPQDFIVEEIASLPFSKNGDFGAYRLKKQGWNTVELLISLSQKLKIPFKNFSYGGRKDRHGIATQYITIRAPKRAAIQGDDFVLSFLGRMQRPMGPDLITENRFEIVVRRLSADDIGKALTEIEGVEACGYPNYFDDQRFGSLDETQGFLAERILKKQFNGALKIYLTSARREDKKEEKERKHFFFEHWREWKICRQKARTENEIRAFDYLINHPTGFTDLLKQMPRWELSAYISAYQSFIWNEVLRRFIKSVINGPLKSHKGIAGNYIFYVNLSGEDYLYLKGLIIPVPGSKLKVQNDDELKSIYAQVMQDNGIKVSMFNNVKLRQAYFKSFERMAIVMPRDLNFSAKDDDLYPGKKKIILKFSLPRGSYATMLVKRIFS